jgi:hypothetical protein
VSADVLARERERGRFVEYSANPLDVLAEYERRHAAETSEAQRSQLRGRARALAEKIGCQPPAWAEMKEQTRAVGREGAYSARERRALRCFRRGGSMRAISKALGVDDHSAIDRWLDGPSRSAPPVPQTFADVAQRTRIDAIEPAQAAE